MGFGHKIEKEGVAAISVSSLFPAKSVEQNPSSCRF
jgi:hypothetical protein